MTTTDTPRTDAASFSSRDPLELMKTSQYLERELCASKAEVERLKGLVMYAAQKYDELLEPYRLRAEKAETLINQIHAFAEALNPNNK